VCYPAEFGRSRSNRVSVGRGPKIWERWARFLRLMAWLINTPLHHVVTCYHAEFGRSVSNDTDSRGILVSCFSTLASPNFGTLGKRYVFTVEYHPATLGSGTPPSPTWYGIQRPLLQGDHTCWEI